MIADLRAYLRTKTSSLPRYLLSECLQALLGWIPTPIGMGVRGITYKIVLRCDGLPAIEDHVRLIRTEDIQLGSSVYLDHQVYLHGGPGGLRIGSRSWVMAGARLHVFNFRGLERAGIRIGRRTFIGEETLMRGQGGIDIGDNVLFGPRVQVLAVNHVISDTEKPIMDQGITAVGIRIEDGCWIGAGAIILDGVTIGKGACIGAGSIVTTSIPPYAVAVGAPARVVRDLKTDPVGPSSPVFFGGMDDLR